MFFFFGLFTGDDEDFTEDPVSGEQSATATATSDSSDTTMKDTPNSPTGSETPRLAESPAPSHTSDAKSAISAVSPPRSSIASPTISEAASVDNKYLDVELELAKAAQAATDSDEIVSPKLKVRLNTVLAADPAANPDAKDIKVICEEKRESAEREEVERRSAEKLGPIVPGLTIVPIELPAAVPPGPRIVVYTCVPCGIKFSSASTLEAHQTYYCSHR